LLIDENYMSFDQLVSKLRQRYGSKDQHQMFKSQLEDREQGPNESLQELAQHIEELTKKAYPGLDPSTIDILARDCFIKALRSPGFQMKIKEHDPATLSEAIAKAMRLETLYKSFEKQKESSRPKLVRSTQQDERPNRNGNGQTSNNKQFDNKANGSFNKNSDVNSTMDGPKRSLPWKNKEAEIQSKETSDLRHQVKQLNMKLSELTTKINQPTVQRTTDNTHFNNGPSSNQPTTNLEVNRIFDHPVTHHKIHCVNHQRLNNHRQPTLDRVLHRILSATTAACRDTLKDDVYYCFNRIHHQKNRKRSSHRTMLEALVVWKNTKAMYTLTSELMVEDTKDYWIQVVIISFR